MPAKGTTVEAILASLPADKRAVVEALRTVILQSLDKDLEEGVQYGGIAYYVPHRVYPNGYHCDPSQPLPFAGIGITKSGLSLHLFCIYSDPEQIGWFRAAWTGAGKKLDMGKSCVRFKRIEDVPLDVVAETIRRNPARAHIAAYEAAFGSAGAAPRKAPAKQKAAARSAATQPSKGRAKAKPAARRKRAVSR